MTRIKTRMTLASTLALLAIPQFVAGYAFSEAFLFVVGGIGLALAALAFAFDRWWAVVPGMVGAAIAAAHTGAFYTAYSHFDSGIEFGYVVSCLVLGTAIVAMGAADLLARRRADVSRMSPAMLRAGGVATLALAAVITASGIVTVTNRDTVSAEERDGAVVVTYRDMEVADGGQVISASPGVLRVVVENKDYGYHDFEVEGFDGKTQLAPKESKLVELHLEAGTYGFRCTIAGHEAMKGIITVE